MKIRLSELKELLREDLTLSERGLFLTILLLRDNDPKLTLAKVKAKVSFKNARLELIHLHELKYIEWSGYKTAKRLEENKKLNPDVITAIEFMNALYKRNFDYKATSTTTGLLQRLKENSLEDIKKVISNRYLVWKDDPVMNIHLNPTTIFRLSKFTKYLEEAKRTRKGEAIIRADAISLRNGQEITAEIAATFIEDEVYNIKTHKVDSRGKISGIGLVGKRYGKDIKKTLMIRDRQVEYGGEKEFIYTYQAN